MMNWWHCLKEHAIELKKICKSCELLASGKTAVNSWLKARSFAR